jgi:ParB/RepB/Spo0J family partition protein
MTNTTTAPTKKETTKAPAPKEGSVSRIRDMEGVSRGGEILMVNPDLLHHHPEIDIRQDQGDLEQLANEIVEFGVNTPLRIFNEGGKLYINFGNRRKRAFDILKKRGTPLQAVPCIVDPKGHSMENRMFELITSNSGKELTMLEQAEMTQRLIKNFGYKPKDIAAKFKRSEGWISNLMLLSSVPKQVKQAIETGKIMPTRVIEMARQTEPTKLVEEVAAFVAEKDSPTTSNGEHKTTAKSGGKKDWKIEVVKTLDLCARALKGNNEKLQMEALEEAQVLADALRKK